VGWTYGDPLDGGQTDYDFGPVNDWLWHAYASMGLWSNDSALSTNTAYDHLVITFPGGDVTAVAGIFAATDIYGETIPYDVIITLDDGTVHTITGEGFVGFTTDIPIVSITVAADNSEVQNWPEVGHFYVGSSQPIPEPATVALLGIAGLGLLARRRRK